MLVATTGSGASGFAPENLLVWAGIVSVICLVWAVAVRAVGWMRGTHPLSALSKTPAAGAARPKLFSLRRAIQGTIVLVVVGGLLLILYPSLVRARELTKRAVCAANLRGISQACRAYAEADPDGVFPPDFATLVALGTVTEKQLSCPSANSPPGDLDASYEYVAGQSPKDDPHNVLIAEKPENHHGEGVHVVYVFGNVEFVKPYARVRELVAETRQRLGARSTRTKAEVKAEAPAPRVPSVPMSQAAKPAERPAQPIAKRPTPPKPAEDRPAVASSPPAVPDSAPSEDAASAAISKPLAPPRQRPGRVAAWGLNDHGQAKVPSGSDFVAISAGSQHCVAIKRDGSLVAWGMNAAGECDCPKGNDYVAVSAGGWGHGGAHQGFSLALKADGSIVGWGSNDYGQLEFPKALSFTAIAAGGDFGVALRGDGRLVAWGGRHNKGRGTKVPSGNDFTAVACGRAFGLALRADGSLVAWGDDEFRTVRDVPKGNGFVAIDCGAVHGLALRADGTVVAWGQGDKRQTTVPAGLSNVIAIAAGDFHNLALRSDGTVVAWGLNDSGQCNVDAKSRFDAVAAGWAHSIALIRPPR